ncbi:branched-chain amino acid ABC transporter permease [Xylophilus rhododendri]|uniref:Branched-chain amino acid ABC transporter permease n=1 Tax=Xylophilus rhododendri TaxID=2697032 RepID=A0A857J6S1_9BURK|nr:AzlC family ABC transporter permease [Xylophilus rhododendri]QHI98731.1 branched-chain amino acid ABC transporter permease [Xylophilus rhododendri]
MTAAALASEAAAPGPVPWRELPRDPEFRRGAIDILGTSLGVGAWGLVTGVAMAKAGLGTGMAVTMALLTYAGSAQLATLPLLAAGSPIWVIWLTACCVNLRFVIFSSMWRSFFGHLPRPRRCALGYFSGDVVFVLFLRRYPVQRPAAGQEAYFWGAAICNWFFWQVPCLIGIFLADTIPVAWGLGFAGVLALLGVAGSMLAGRLEALSAVVAAAGAVAAFALPLKLNILVGIAAAVVVGLVAEQLIPPHSRVVRRARVASSSKKDGA